MTFVCYTGWDQLPDSANALFAQAENDSLFLSRPWLECLTATALEADHTLVLAGVVSGDRALALLPLMQCAGVNTWYALRHGFTPLYGLLLAEEDPERALACLAEGLSQVPVNGLLLEPVAGDDRKLHGLQNHLTAAGYRCDYRFRHYNWIHRLQGQSFAEYLAARPAHLRNTLARKARKLEREHGYTVRLFTGADVLRAMADYYAVYQASWKQNEIRNAAFQDGVIEQFSGAGWTRLAILYVKGRPVAAQLWFVHHHKASIFRLAYDKAWRPYSPGSILTRYLMEHVIDTDRVTEIDFLIGNEAYKQDWMSERRERYLLGCVKNKKPTGWTARFASTVRGQK